MSMTSVNDFLAMVQTFVDTPSQRQKQRDDTRERIYRAAVAEFQRVGFGNAQISRIAEASGVVRGTFYFHFTSKDHVLREIAERAQEQVAAELRELRGQGVPVDRVLARLVGAVTRVDASLGEANLLRDVLSMYVRAPLDPEPAEQLPGVLEELTEQLAEAMDRGELRRDLAPDRLAATVLASVFGVIVTRSGPDADRHVELELLIDLLLQGMGRGESASR